MMFLNRSILVSHFLHNTSRSVRLVPGVFKNTLHTSSTKFAPYVDLFKLNHQRPFLNPSLYQTINFRYYTSDKSSTTPTQDNATEEDEQEKRAKAWKKMKRGLIVMGSSMGLLFCWCFYFLGAPERDENGKDLEDEFSSMPLIQQWCTRFYHKARYYKKVIQEPSQEKLLPDVVQYPYIQPPYTLVLELTDVLVHPDWTYQTGWRFKKRPHVDAFLQQVAAPMFEIVIFTAEQSFSMAPIVNQLNKNGLIAGALFRDSTDFRDSHHVKNLDWLNRDLSKVIVVDWNSQSIKLHPDNGFVIPRWRGDDSDTALLDLATFLRMIAFSKVEDVREVLSYYRQFEDPLAKFRENQQILLEQMEQQERIEQEKKQRPPLTKPFAKTYAR